MQSFRVGGGWLQSYTGCPGKASLGKGQLIRDMKEELQGAVFMAEGPGKGPRWDGVCCICRTVRRTV